MAINTKIPQDNWLDFCVGFSNGNQGRVVTIETIGPGSANIGPANEGKLMALDYDPPKAGDVLVISTGVNEVSYVHNVHNPVELWKAQRDDGTIMALELLDGKGVKTILHLK